VSCATCDMSLVLTAYFVGEDTFLMRPHRVNGPRAVSADDGTVLADSLWTDGTLATLHSTTLHSRLHKML